jgi:hypothetical protein
LSDCPPPPGHDGIWIVSDRTRHRGWWMGWARKASYVPALCRAGFALRYCGTALSGCHTKPALRGAPLWFQLRALPFRDIALPFCDTALPWGNTANERAHTPPACALFALARARRNFKRARSKNERACRSQERARIKHGRARRNQERACRKNGRARCNQERACSKNGRARCNFERAEAQNGRAEARIDRAKPRNGMRAAITSALCCNSGGLRHGAEGRSLSPPSGLSPSL